MKCKSCEGHGISTCRKCSGTGFDYGHHKCSQCSGQGTVNCSPCEGKGKVPFFKRFKSG